MSAMGRKQGPECRSIADPRRGKASPFRLQLSTLALGINVAAAVREMRTMLTSSRAHLAEVGETYFEHMRFALLVGALAVGAGIACALHAIVPGLCPATCSRTVALLQDLFADRRRLPSVVAQSSALLLFVVL